MLFFCCRLSQGHARIMMHQEVEISDAVTAVMLLEMSLERSSSLFCLDFNLNADFPENPNQQHDEITEIILKKLGLYDLIKNQNLTESSVQMDESYGERSTSLMEQDENQAVSNNNENRLEQPVVLIPHNQEENLPKNDSDDTLFLPKTDPVNENNPPMRKNKNRTKDIHMKKWSTHDTNSGKDIPVNASENTEFTPEHVTTDNSLKSHENIASNMDKKVCLNPIKVSNVKSGQKLDLNQFQFKPREKTNDSKKKSVDDLQILNLIPSVNDAIYNLDVEMEDEFSMEDVGGNVFAGCMPQQTESVTSGANTLSGKPFSIFDEDFDDSDLNI